MAARDGRHPICRLPNPNEVALTGSANENDFSSNIIVTILRKKHGTAENL